MEEKLFYRITVAEMAPHVHSFLPGENKVDKLVNWLTDWITFSLECGKIKPYDMLPSKADLACHIGVSQGTMQNVFRLVEDAGYIESKQRIGSYVKDKQKDIGFEKLTSKRELAIEIIKKYISENAYKVGDTLISTRKLSSITGISNTTLRAAMSTLIARGILEKRENSFIIKNKAYTIDTIQTKTLVEKIADNIKEYINLELTPGDRLPANAKLAAMFNVSIKTIHDAVKLLAKEGILYTRRGKYGTIVMGKEEQKIGISYNYERVELKIKHYIEKKCNVGDKLPSIKEFALNFETSSKTVKKALDNLASDGFLTFARGRYGGTFVMDIPQEAAEAYKWLAINTNYVNNIEN